MEETNFKEELRKIADSLKLFSVDECPNRNSQIKDSQPVPDRRTPHPKSSETVLDDIRHLGGADLELYMELFLCAVYLATSKPSSSLRAALLMAFASLEVFLRKATRFQLKKAEFGDDLIRKLLRSGYDCTAGYRDLFGIVSIETEDQYCWDGLLATEKIRDDVLCRGAIPEDEDVLMAFDGISKAFASFSQYYPGEIDG